MNKWGADIGRAALDEARKIIGTSRTMLSKPERTCDAGRDWFEANRESIEQNLGKFKLDKMEPVK